MDSKSKKIIEKLVKIAENQQKIINKMAEELSGQHIAGGPMSSAVDVSKEVLPVVQQAARESGAKSQYGVQSAEFYKDTGYLKLKLTYPMSQLGSPESKAVTEKTKELLVGKFLSDGQVSKVEVIGVAI